MSTVEADGEETGTAGVGAEAVAPISPDPEVRVKSEPESSGDESSQELREFLGRTDTVVVYPEDPQGIQQDTGKKAGYKQHPFV